MAQLLCSNDNCYYLKYVNLPKNLFSVYFKIGKLPRLSKKLPKISLALKDLDLAKISD